MEQYVETQVTDSIAMIRLSRPEKRNALGPVMVAQLHEALLSAERDPTVRVIVLTGAGSAFCAGADLAYLEQINANSPLENEADSRSLMYMMRDFRYCAKPTVARLNGHAIAGGCGLALTCDIIVASDEARLGFTETRIGFVPAIVMKLLMDRVGPGRARELLLRGHLLPAIEAERIGMINHAVRPEQLDALTAEITSDLAQRCSPESLRLTKRLIDEVMPLDPREAMERGVIYNTISRTTPDFKKGINSFLGKETPRW
jgi:methylglutaconyl-CoA hydratase